MSESTPHLSAPEIRAPLPGEEPRVGYFFRAVSIPSHAYILMAVKKLPVERFVAGVAWWMEDRIARFRLVFLPGVSRDCASSLTAKVSEGARRLGAEHLYYADLLADDHELTSLLCSQGIGKIRSERFFEIATETALVRVEQMFEKYRAEIPSQWHTESIRSHAPEEVFDLVMKHRLLPPAELQRYWQSTSLGFDLDFSCILFDGERPFGTLLIREAADTLYYDVRVIHEPNTRLRALGNLLLFRHNTRMADRKPHIRRLRFRGGETEHRETANLAFRMGGRELPSRHVFGKDLKS